jgi:hypothetical protein
MLCLKDYYLKNIILTPGICQSFKNYSISYFTFALIKLQLREILLVTSFVF